MTATTIAPPLPVPRLQRLRWAARDGWLIAQRDVAQGVREPQMIVWGLVFENPGVPATGWLAEHAILMAVLWPLAITALTLPWAVRTFQKLSR